MKLIDGKHINLCCEFWHWSFSYGIFMLPFQMTTEAVEQPQQAEEKKPEVEVEAVG